MSSLIIGEHYGLHTVVKGSDGEQGGMASMNAVGIEVEMEDALEAPSVRGWFKVSDASLRNNGIEYVLSGPQCGKYLENSIRYLGKLEETLKPELNERCSTHVHLDFSNNTLKEVGNFAMLFAIYEDVLFSMCDASRSYNPYCVPVRGSKVLRDFIRKANEDKASALITMAMSNGYRYGSINFAPLGSFGSIEIRIREGLINEEELKLWVNTLLYMKEHAIKCSNVVEEFKSNPNAFTVRTFPLATLPDQYLYSKMAVKTLESIEPFITQAFIDTSKGRDLNWSWTPPSVTGDTYVPEERPSTLRAFFNERPIMWFVECPDGIRRHIQAATEPQAIEIASNLYPNQPSLQEAVSGTYGFSETF